MALRRDTGTAIGFLLPYGALLVVFGIGPVIYALILSFTQRTMGVLQYVGTTNYSHVLSDYRFFPSIEHILAFTVVWLPLMVVLVVTLAVLVHRRSSRFAAASKFTYFLPGAVTGSAGVLLWIFMLEPSVSVFGWLLRAVGITSLPEAIAPSHLPVVLAVMLFFSTAGGFVVVLHGALTGISSELYEAASIDGAGPVRTALSIEIPLIKKSIGYMILLCLAGATQLFVEPQTLGLASQGRVPTTWSPNQLAYDYAFNQADFGGAAAISMFLLLLGGVGSFCIVRFVGFFDTEASDA